MLFIFRHNQTTHRTRSRRHSMWANHENNSGSALLIALIIMGILLTIAIGVSQLLIRSYKDNRQLIDRTNAWYGAESGIETALFKVTHNPPGFEATEENLGKTDAEPTQFHNYSIKAAGKQVPEQLYDGQPDNEQFNELALGQTITIPLFSGTNPDQGVQKVVIEYSLTPKLKLNSHIPTEDLDILRWKIFGRSLVTGHTEVISDLAPEKSATADTTCVGTLESCPYQGGKYFQQNGTDDTPEFQLMPTYYISAFLAEHKQNFLILTNMVNVDLIDSTLGQAEKKKLASIRYRVRQLDANDAKMLSLPTASIKADGFARDTKQSIDIELDREKSLPIFNYALYRTE